MFARRDFLILILAMLLGAALVREAKSVHMSQINIVEYFPIQKSNQWVYAVTIQKRNGTIEKETSIWKVHGRKNIHGKNAWIIGDKESLLMIYSIDQDGLQCHGDEY